MKGFGRTGGKKDVYRGSACVVDFGPKLVVATDVRTGNNAYGAAGGGLYLYFTDTIDMLTGPVYFLDSAVQPGGKHWMSTVQLDVDIRFKAAPPGARRRASFRAGRRGFRVSSTSLTHGFQPDHAAGTE